MSADGKLGARKLRRIERLVGEPLLMAFSFHPIVEAVTPDDRHLLVNPSTGEVEQRVFENASGHWNTCPGQADGPPLPAVQIKLPPAAGQL